MQRSTIHLPLVCTFSMFTSLYQTMGRSNDEGIRSWWNCDCVSFSCLRWRNSSTANAANSSRSEEHTSELQSLMRISYAVFCLKKKTKQTNNNNTNRSQTD